MAPMFAAFILAGYVTGEHKHIIFERNREKGETQYRIALREAKETGRVNV
ncbi:MAG: hypothetical protein Q8P67_09315 [archaeon]|nr:hypothetical protein [archaeon]